MFVLYQHHHDHCHHDLYWIFIVIICIVYSESIFSSLERQHLSSKQGSLLRKWDRNANQTYFKPFFKKKFHTFFLRKIYISYPPLWSYQILNRAFSSQSVRPECKSNIFYTFLGKIIRIFDILLLELPCSFVRLE